MKKFARSYLSLFLAILAGVGTGLTQIHLLMTAAETVSKLFLNFLSMIAAPIVLLSILSTLIGTRFEQMLKMGRKVLLYTLLTTFLAAIVALGCFITFDPVSSSVQGPGISAGEQTSYLQFLVDIVPSNIFTAFAENKVISIAFLGFIFGIASHYLQEEHRSFLQKGVSATFQLFLKIAGVISYIMPIAIWAFVSILIKDLNQQSTEVSGLWSYLGAIVTANLIQGIVVIPLLLKLKGISPLHLAKKGMKALLMAFFTKSSNATLPLSLKVAQEEMGIHPKVAHFTLPLCTVINMNGCAAFILTTVLFVAGTHGHIFSPLDLAFWVVMSVLAAVGNAGVPMGCFFLSSAFLVSIGVPLSTMGLIFPFYAFIDMEETALNVWSDLSVTKIVNQECKEEVLEDTTTFS